MENKDDNKLINLLNNLSKDWDNTIKDISKNSKEEESNIVKELLKLAKVKEYKNVLSDSISNIKDSLNKINDESIEKDNFEEEYSEPIPSNHDIKFENDEDEIDYIISGIVKGSNDEDKLKDIVNNKEVNLEDSSNDFIDSLNKHLKEGMDLFKTDEFPKTSESNLEDSSNDFIDSLNKHLKEGNDLLKNNDRVWGKGKGCLEDYLEGGLNDYIKKIPNLNKGNGSLEDAILKLILNGYNYKNLDLGEDFTFGGNIIKEVLNKILKEHQGRWEDSNGLNCGELDSSGEDIIIDTVDFDYSYNKVLKSNNLIKYLDNYLSNRESSCINKELQAYVLIQTIVKLSNILDNLLLKLNELMVNKETNRENMNTELKYYYSRSLLSLTELNDFNKVIERYYRNNEDIMNILGLIKLCYDEIYWVSLEYNSCVEKLGDKSKFLTLSKCNIDKEFKVDEIDYLADENFNKVLFEFMGSNDVNLGSELSKCYTFDKTVDILIKEYSNSKKDLEDVRKLIFRAIYDSANIIINGFDMNKLFNLYDLLQEITN